MGFQIEECRRPEDVEGCLRWLPEALAAIYPAEAGERSAEAAREFVLRSLGQRSSLFLRGDREGSLAGFLFVGPREDPFLGAQMPFLYVLFVLPEHRRLNLAAALLRRGEQILQDRGLKKLLAPATHNDDAIISMGERRGYLREREFMVKEL